MSKKKPIDLSQFNFTEEDLRKGLADPVWRLSNLYKIVNTDKEVVVFRPNAAQKELMRNIHLRNVILKARKMGFSTFIQLLMLDTALFSPNERGKVIAQDRDTAEEIFRDVFKFAYDNLPEPLKIAVPVAGEASKDSITFTNNSIVEVTTSARGRTPTFLHVSEFGKIAAKDPGKAKEIITGSITAVAEDGLVFVESTAEGQEGAFYDLVQTARNLKDAHKTLWKLDFKFHFFGWWQDPRYVAPKDIVVINKEDQEYFDELELEIKTFLPPERRAWYVKYRDATYAGDKELMWQEMPSTPDEAFKVSMEGAYWKDQFKRIRNEHRIGPCPYDPHYPVSWFFDIGVNDQTAAWAIQPKRTHFGVINYIETSGEPFSYFVNEIDRMGYVLGYVYLPHDANQRRQGADKNMTAEEMFASVAPHWRFWLVPRTPDKQMSIQQTRNFLNLCTFDEANCALGLRRLESYRKEWNPRSGTWRNTPRHGPESNGADAFQQAAQANASGYFSAIGGMSNVFDSEFGSSFLPEPELDF